MARSPHDNLQDVIDALKDELIHQHELSQLVGEAFQPKMASRLERYGRVNPHLPIGWPTMPKGLVAKLAAYTKKIVRRLLRWYINPIVDQQNDYNRVASEYILTLEQNQQRLESRLEQLETASTASLQAPSDSASQPPTLPEFWARCSDLLSPLVGNAVPTVPDSDASETLVLVTAKGDLQTYDLVQGLDQLKTLNRGAVKGVVLADSGQLSLTELARLINAAAQVLAPGGLLLLHLSEATMGEHPAVQPVRLVAALCETLGLNPAQVRYLRALPADSLSSLAGDPAQAGSLALFSYQPS